MALMADQHGARTEMPTPLRLAEARRAGRVARSRDLVCVAVLAAGTIALALSGAGLVASLKEMTSRTLAEAGRGLSETSALRIPWDVLRPVVARSLTLAAAVVAVAALANLAQFGWLVSADPVRPQVARLNPATGFGRMFSVRSLIHGVLSVGKVAAVVAVFVTMLPEVMGGAESLATGSLAGAVSQLGALAWRLSVKLVAVLALLALTDLLYQRWQYRRDLKITRRQLLDDFRRMEGDPRYSGYRRMMAERLAPQGKKHQTDET